MSSIYHIILDELKVFIKFTLSFCKTEWTLEDYPLKVEHLKHGEAVSWTGEPIPWWVRIIRWPQMSGHGQSKNEAFSDLRNNLNTYLKRRGELPRPGKSVPIEVADSSIISTYDNIARVFLEKILDMDYNRIFISDESSLWDFCMSENDQKKYLKKVKQIFNLDISDLEDGNLIKIFQRISLE